MTGRELLKAVMTVSVGKVMPFPAIHLSCGAAGNLVLLLCDRPAQHPWVAMSEPLLNCNYRSCTDLKAWAK